MTQSPIRQQTIQLVATQIPKTEKLEEMLAPFALDETLIRHLTKEEDGPFVHFWTLEDIVILGMTDTKVPYLEQGLERLRANGFTPIVRQAGGLAVVSNEGILNISLLFKNKQMPTINEAYEWMQQLIQETFPEAEALGGIQAFEVTDSYCPGDYDLSIQNRKMCAFRFTSVSTATKTVVGLWFVISMTTHFKEKKRNGISQKSTPTACGILATPLESTSPLKTFKSASCRL